MIRASIIGAGIALLCFLPPILHFILGPFGPMIGGFFAALRMTERKPSFKDLAYTGLLTGLLLTVSILIISIPTYFIIQMVGDDPIDIFESVLLLSGIFLGILIWALVLGTVGAVLAAGSIKKRLHE